MEELSSDERAGLVGGVSYLPDVSFAATLHQSLVHHLQNQSSICSSHR